MRSVVVAVLLAACSGDQVDSVDANPAGPRCSNVVYDLCREEHDCASMICQNFGAEGFQVCSQGCVEGGTPCPDDRSGAPGTCAGGVCRPSAPNRCHL